MGTQLEYQHQIDRHLVAWAKAHEPGLGMKIFVVIAFSLAGILSFSNPPAAVPETMIIPAVIGAVGVFHSFHK